MTIFNIKSRDAILAAIHDFDELGRDEFLKKYGFGYAKDYFLCYEGRYYDSKAIVGAAHGFEFGQFLKAADFSGGVKTVQQLLEKLGFQVVFRGNALELTLPPVNHRAKRKTLTPRRIDYSARDDRNREIGLAGELLVLEYEKNQLTAAGYHELAAQVYHVSLLDGDGAGYDIRSFTSDGMAKYIEVKTTTGSKGNAFFLSSNERNFYEENPGSAYIYRVYNFDREMQTGKFYMIEGALDEWFDLTPTEYRVSPKSTP
jgi:hypothetical protein